MAKINIEFAHIYLNESFSDEHKASVLQYKDISRILLKEHDIVNMIMIDDYNTTDTLLDVNDMFEQIRGFGVKPDFYVYEADFTRMKDEILDLLSPRHSKQYSKYIEEKGIVPCSLLIIISYLFRLRLIAGNNTSIIHSLNDKPVEDFFAEQIINILPRRFESVEKKAFEAIAESKPFENLNIEDKISEFFF